MLAARTRLAGALATAAVVAGLTVPAGAASPPPPDGPARAASRLRADASSTFVSRGPAGAMRFAAVGGHGRIDNPSVDGRDSVRAAARAHLERYGAAFGADRPGTTLADAGTAGTVSGQDVVRYDQSVDGVPVLGGQVVLTLGAQRDLTAASASLSTAQSVPAARVAERAAAGAARAVVARDSRRRAADLAVSSDGRSIFDPAVFGEPSTAGARTGWRFEVTGADGVRRLVLVDDQTGAVLLDIDDNQSIDRVVCDNANTPRTTDLPCTTGFARTETSGPSTLAEANSAFDLAGAVSDFYRQIVGLDLTQLLGISVGGRKRLASTVRWCYTGETCPYDNAFWNGRQMYYGQGYAGADDVVGHEMTHGVIDHFSQLFYWGQSGAINESLADIMGEIIDHRHPSPSDVASNWQIGEDLPGGAIRSLSNPTQFGQPDRMTSNRYTSDAPSYSDNGGVHTDSGVGNKTAYLISQGGSFNGQTITGIDAGDPQLTKTATLYADVTMKLSSGSDYADLAGVLEQSCQALVTAQRVGFTSADCTRVHQATVATELRTTPTQARQPADAPANSCPSGTRQVEMLDSETGNAATFTAGPNWVRGASPTWGSNATSGTASWSNTHPWSSADTTPGASSLTLATPVSLPAGQRSYLRFQGWYLLDYVDATYYDAGTVEVDRTDDPQPPIDAATLPWVDGPSQVIAEGSGNPAAGRLGFGGDSRGWIASQLDLSSLAGHPVRPRFTLDNDSAYWSPGWFLDDITVYTCSTRMLLTAAPTVRGTDRVGGRLTATPGGWLPAPERVSYQWLRDGRPVTGATGAAYVPVAADLRHRLSVQVTASATGLIPGQATSAAAAPVAPGVLSAPRPKVAGTAKVGKVLRAVPGTWSPRGVALSYQWLRNGQAIKRATKTAYKLTKKDRGKKISVRVTGRKAGYTTASVTSRPTGKVR
ncbi:M4 family metallopeptidase [Nocardioides sp. CER19]|uniref:M4 family metallopeptidase n=1 Tax=Nocardioides sp. CER19 TaxID=3038538 RepID=UPI00244D0DD9|nr:M4 family metallopeptidase [Nocardioides sp. CER19]MDH2416397.1 M4 family metallopeptidase [Nocardioides sp. CER19]